MATESRYLKAADTLDRLVDLAGEALAQEIRERLYFRKYWEARYGTKFVLYDNTANGPENIEIIKLGALSMRKGALFEADLSSDRRTEPLVLYQYPVKLWERDACLFIAKHFEYDTVALVRGPNEQVMFFPRVGLLTQEASPPNKHTEGVTNLLPLSVFREEFGFSPEM